MGIKDIVSRYFPEIEIRDMDVDVHAWMEVYLPTGLIREYKMHYGIGEDFPDVEEFWKNTGMRDRLQMIDSARAKGHESLEEVLIYMGEDVGGEFSQIHPETVYLRVQELRALETL